MDPGRLRTLVAVIDAGSFSAGAERLGVSQPAVSQHIASLERHVGVPLFERAGRRRVPTDAARLLAEQARGALAAVDGVVRLAEELRGLRRGRVVVGASTTPGAYVVPPALGTFAGLYPDVEVRIEIADTGEIERRLRARLVDLAVVGEYEAGDDLVVVPLRPDRLVPVCGRSSPLAGKRRVTLERFLGERLVAREAGSSTRDVFERWAAANGFALAPAMELSSTEAIKQAVAAGLGVGVVSEATATLELETGLLQTPRVTGFPIERTIDVALRRGARPSRPTVAFLEVLMGPRRSRSLLETIAA